ncbi:MAG: ABC transporter permease [Acidimicrobiales bacterium]
MSVLRRKIGRDLRRQRGQNLAIAATVIIGVTLYAASYDAFLNLETSYNQTYQRLAFADVTVSGGDTPRFAEQANALDGVAAVTVRRQADEPVRIGGDHSLLGRVVEVTGDAQPAVNQLDVLQGAFPSSTGQAGVLVERHMAEHFALEPGATIELFTDGQWQTYPVAAVVASPEYLWPARSRQDILTTADDFGVVFAPTAIFDQAATNPITQTLVRFEPDTDTVGLEDQVRTLAVDAGASDIEPRADQPSNAALQEDVSGFGELSFLFPLLFLGSAAMATFVLQGRLVRFQRPQIATLMANGLSATVVVRHYLLEGIAVTGLAGIVGLIIGVPLGRLVTGLYTDAISVPDTVTGFHPSTVLVGLALAIVTGVVASAAPALAAARTAPGDALRGQVPTGRGGRSTLERLVPPLGNLPARWRMVLRGIGRNKRRAVSTGLGVVLSLTLILASWGMVDTVDILVDRQFNQIQRQDAQLHLASSDQSVMAAIGRVPGVARVEPVLELPVTVTANERSYATELMAFEPDTMMHDFGPGGLPPSGLVAGRSLASILDVSVGDTVAVTRQSSGVSTELPIVAFVDEPLGTLVYASRPSIEAGQGEPQISSVLVTFTASADRQAMRNALTGVPGVVAYVDSRGLYDTARSLLSLFYAFVGVMLGFGALMAFALIFNTTSVNAAERAPELAAMQLNGSTRGQITRLLAGETLLLTSAAIVPGLVIGYLVSARFMASFSSDLFDFGLEIRTSTLALSALAILIVAALAQWATARAVANLDIATVVRERSQ